MSSGDAAARKPSAASSRLGLALAALIGTAGMAAAEAIPSVAAFAPSTVTVSEPVTMTIEMQNPTNTDFTGVGFNETLPAGMTFAQGGPNIALTCEGVPTPVGTVSTVGNDNFILSGLTIPAAIGAVPGSCSVTLQVKPDALGTFNYILDAGDVSNGTGDFNPAPSDISLFSTGDPVSGQITARGEFDAPNGVITTTSGTVLEMGLRINNPNDVALTGGTTSFEMPTDIGLTGGAIDFDSCTIAPTVVTNTAVTPNVVTISDMEIAPNGTCTVWFPIQNVTDPHPSFGFLRDFSEILPGEFTTDQGIENGARIARNFHQWRGIQNVKRFSPDEIFFEAGQTTTLSINTQSRNRADLPDYGYTDALPAGLVYTGTFSTDCGATVAFSAGNTS